ncbi:glycoside hydrolase family 15 protein [Amniculicola lignicola CBS 123094]|uniref:glucan 1,4-alpha-glucosidase n=1 Tax=Amniculicola lignicola CBS 123094 TaxID=1392246 RepID=A0A6A5W5Y0_9PLEO|nr:glycoside hydrolase family 15 protein [Amniculicola lignicola CBS 123094]
MAILVPLVLVAYLVLYAFAFPFTIPVARLPIQNFLGVGHAGEVQKPLRESLDGWIEQQERRALEKLLENVAPGGRNVEDVVGGAVIASPSKEHPNYFYQWVRDAAITLSTLVEIYADDTSSKRAPHISRILDDYAQLQLKLQHTDNPSGTFDDLAGLGEPKFEADGRPFIGSWGRPQRDGPALRALTLMEYVRAYNQSHPSLWKSDGDDDWYSLLYDASMPANSIIKADLEYVSHFWNQSGFDLWEEVDGLHFFTAMVQMRAMREGADLARAFSDYGAADWYNEQAERLSGFVQAFWDDKKGHLVETLNSDRTGLDCALLLGSLHGLPASYSTDSPIYPPHSDEILVSLLALVQDQRLRFPINAAPVSTEEDFPILEGVGIGRYPEDVYDGYGTDKRGGHPWFLCTASAAEVLFRTASYLTSTSNLTITQTGLPFYEALLGSSSLDPESDTTYGPSDAIFHSIIEHLKSTGDEFLDVIRTHTSGDGSMSEQFDRETGYERGAKDLTWSYGAFLKAVRARKSMGRSDE